MSTISAYLERLELAHQIVSDVLVFAGKIWPTLVRDKETGCEEMAGVMTARKLALFRCERL